MISTLPVLLYGLRFSKCIMHSESVCSSRDGTTHFAPASSRYPVYSNLPSRVFLPDLTEACRVWRKESRSLKTSEEKVRACFEEVKSIIKWNESNKFQDLPLERVCALGTSIWCKFKNRKKIATWSSATGSSYMGLQSLFDPHCSASVFRFVSRFKNW